MRMHSFARSLKKFQREIIQREIIQSLFQINASISASVGCSVAINNEPLIYKLRNRGHCSDLVQNQDCQLKMGRTATVFNGAMSTAEKSFRDTLSVYFHIYMFTHDDSYLNLTSWM